MILIDVQYSQKVIFSFEKGSNGQNHSSSGSQCLVKKNPASKISDSSCPLTLFGKTLLTLGVAVAGATQILF